MTSTWCFSAPTHQRNSLKLTSPCSWARALTMSSISEARRAERIDQHDPRREIVAGFSLQQLAAGRDLVLQLSDGHDFGALAKAAEIRCFRRDRIDRVGESFDDAFDQTGCCRETRCRLALLRSGVRRGCRCRPSRCIAAAAVREFCVVPVEEVTVKTAQLAPAWQTSVPVVRRIRVRRRNRDRAPTRSRAAASRCLWEKCDAR